MKVQVKRTMAPAAVSEKGGTVTAEHITNDGTNLIVEVPQANAFKRGVEKTQVILTETDYDAIAVAAAALWA